MIEKPTVLFDNEVYRKILHWVKKSNYEVSGLGTVTCDKDGVFHVKSAMLLPQKNGTTHTDIEPEDVGKLMFAFKDKPGDLRFWWHSHVDMDVFWSGTDLDTIKKIGQGGWFLSSVFNKKEHVRSAYYAVQGAITPWGNKPVFIDDLKTEYLEDDSQRIAQWNDEYEKNVTNVTHRVYSGGGTWDGDDYMGYGWTRTESGSWVMNREESENKRPPGISKREWKRMKREEKGLSRDITNPTKTDVYGFTPAERKLLAAEGWGDMTIDEFKKMGVTNSQMMTFAKWDLWPRDVKAMKEQGWTLADIEKRVDEISAEISTRALGGTDNVQ